MMWRHLPKKSEGQVEILPARKDALLTGAAKQGSDLFQLRLVKGGEVLYT